jgi:hypothetical protein
VAHRVALPRSQSLPRQRSGGPGTPRPMFPNNLGVNEAVQRALLSAVENGADPDQALATLPGVIGEVIDTTSQQVVHSLDRGRASMLREHARAREAFEKRLRKRWGKSLGKYYAVVVAAEEAGADFNSWIRSSDAVTPRADALTRILALSCQVAKEIYTLLSAGYKAGAAARWRTLHELAVTAIVLGEQDENYSVRFLAYVDVETWEDAQQYQLHAAALGQQPLSNEELAATKGRHDAAVAKFGKEFADANGWAFPLFAPRRPSFKGLEKLAGVSHLRPYYKFSTHHAHGGSKGVMGNAVRVGRETFLLTGATDSGFAEIAHGALLSLVQAAIALMVRGGDITQNAQALVVARALRMLAADGGAALADAELNYPPPAGLPHDSPS